MEFKKLVAPTLKEMFIENIQGMILSGELEEGRQLPPERAIAESMGVSRAVVNAGIVELERMGFLEVRPRIGTFVADYRRKGTLETLKAIMYHNRGRMRDEEIRSILQVRDALDKLAVGCIAEKASNEEIACLKELAEKIRQAGSNEDAAKAAFEFQHEMAMISGNTLLPLIFRSFYFSVIVLWERFCALYGREELYRVSYQTWERLAARDAAGAVVWIEKCTREAVIGERQIYY